MLSNENSACYASSRVIEPDEKCGEKRWLSFTSAFSALLTVYGASLPRRLQGKIKRPQIERSFMLGVATFYSVPRFPPLFSYSLSLTCSLPYVFVGMDLDVNSWYRLTTAAATKLQQSLVGSYPYIDGKEGPVTFGDSDNSIFSQQWQLFPVGSTRYMLRTKASGPQGYLATVGSHGFPSNSKPVIYNHSTTDQSMLWSIQPWANSTFYLSNDADGHDSHLDFSGAGRIAMSTNTTPPQPGQSFSLVKVSQIDDAAFSTANIPSQSLKPTTFASRTLSVASKTSTSTFIQNVSSISTSSRADPSSTLTASGLTGTPSPPAQKARDGLSFSVILGIGVTIGVVSVVAILAICLLVFRGWKRSRLLHSQHYRQAKLWKGFSPVHSRSVWTPTTTAAAKRMGGVYVTELPVPASPPAIASPPLSGGGHLSWNSRHFSWQSIPGTQRTGASPSSPSTPSSQPFELPA